MGSRDLHSRFFVRNISYRQSRTRPYHRCCRCAITSCRTTPSRPVRHRSHHARAASSRTYRASRAGPWCVSRTTFSKGSSLADVFHLYRHPASNLKTSTQNHCCIPWTSTHRHSSLHVVQPRRLVCLGFAAPVWMGMPALIVLGVRSSTSR